MYVLLCVKSQWAGHNTAGILSRIPLSASIQRHLHNTYTICYPIYPSDNVEVISQVSESVSVYCTVYSALEAPVKK